MTRRAAKRMRLTVANAGKFRPMESEYTIWDTKIPGLGVRVKPTGYRTWVYHDSASGKPRRYSLGPVPLMTIEDVRRKCLAFQIEGQTKGVAGKSEKTSVPVFREFVEGEWKTTRYNRMKPSTRIGITSNLASQLLPTFGKMPLDRITCSRVIRWFDEYSRSAPGGANRALDTLSGILNHAVVCGHIPVSPTRGIRRNPKRKMTRFLSREEIRRLHEVLDTCVAECPASAPKADIIRLLLQTGCRRGEILGLRWCEVGENVLELMDSKTGPRAVFLNPDAKAIIERQPWGDSTWVFPSFLDRTEQRSTGSVEGFWRKVRKRAGIEDVRLHDLRHTVATQAVLRGVPLPVVARLLGHSQVSMTLRYTHVAEKEIEAAAERVGSLIADYCGIPDS